MIRVDRGPRPDILTTKAAAWRAALSAAATDKARKKAERKYNHPQVREALKKAFHGKCAYCESDIVHIGYPHIEHYRPKSTYPAKTFAWNNFLLACGVCNGKEYKGDQFPKMSEGGPYVNPCKDEPSVHFDFKYDPLAAVATVVPKTARGKITRTDLGLNRANLRKHRSAQIAKLYYIARKASHDPEARKLLTEATAADSEYSAFAAVLRDSFLP